MIGNTISHYKIIEKLCCGGMGEVYLAEDLKLERKVAIKSLPQYLSNDKNNIARLIREAKATAALNHPNIVTIYEIFEENTQTFIAMEYIDGESLRSKMDKGFSDVTEILDITFQICDGLLEAHNADIIHRDIKPENIIIDKNARVKILDFGLAKLKGISKLTRELSTVGTIQYMSPEQIRGEEVDQRTDIWSLGVVLFEMLNCELPFKGDYEQAVIYSILNEQPGLKDHFENDINNGIKTVIKKCLKKDIHSRYQNIIELLSELNSYRQNLSIINSGTKKTSIKDILNKNKTIYISISLVLLTIFILIIFRSYHSEKQYSDRKMLVVLPFENLGSQEDEYFADGITEEITNRLGVLKGLGVISRTSALNYKKTNKSIKQIGKELNVDYVLEGTVRWQQNNESNERIRITPRLIRVRDDSYIWSETYDQFFGNIFNIQSEIAKEVISQLDVAFSESENYSIDLKPTDNLVAYQAYLRGLDYMKYSHAPEDQYIKAQNMFEQAVILDPNFALAFAKLSDAHRSLYFFGYDHTPERIEKAKAAIDIALELAPELPAVRTSFGYFYYHCMLDYDKALKEFSIAAKKEPNNIDLLNNIAFVWRRQGLFQQAIKNLEYSLSLSPNNAYLLAELAQSYLFIRDYEKAIQYCNKCIEIASDNKWAYMIKANSYWCWQGNLEEAGKTLKMMPDKQSPYSVLFLYLQEIYERNYQTALDILSTFPYEAIEVQSSYTPKNLLIGWVYSQLKDSLRANSYYELARDFLEGAVRKNPNDPRIHSSLGIAYANLGLDEKAIEEGEKAVEFYPVSKDALLGTNRVMDLISIYIITKNYEKAVDRIVYLLSIPSSYSIHYLLLNPRTDNIRELPKFKSIINRFSEI